MKTISRKDQVCWLAGILDGEGCVIAYLDREAKHGKTLDLKIKIVNTDMFMIQRISKIFVDNHLGFYYALNGNTNPALEIAVSGQIRVEKFLKMLEHLLSGSKAKQAQLALELIQYRRNLGYKSQDGSSLLDNSTIQKFVDNIKALKAFRVSPLVCTRQANKILGIPIDYTLDTFNVKI